MHSTLNTFCASDKDDSLSHENDGNIANAYCQSITAMTEERAHLGMMEREPASFMTHVREV